MRPQLNKTFGLTDPKLNNPFANENPIGGLPIGNFSFNKPTDNTGLIVNTKDPVVISQKPFSFTDKTKPQMEWEARRKLNENLIKLKEEKEKSWWQKQSKTAKVVYIGLGVLAVSSLAYFVIKKFGK